MTRKDLLIQEAARYIARSQPRDLSKAKMVGVSCNAEGSDDPVDYMVKDGDKEHKYNGIHDWFLELPHPDDDRAEEYDSDKEFVASMKDGKKDFEQALVNKHSVPPDHAKAIAQHAHDFHMADFSGEGFKPESKVRFIRSQRPFRMNDPTADSGEPEYFHTSTQKI